LGFFVVAPILEPFVEENSDVLFVKFLKWFEERFFIKELCIEVSDGSIKVAKMFFVKRDTFTKRTEVGNVFWIKFQQGDHITPEANTKGLSLFALIALTQFGNCFWKGCFIRKGCTDFSQPSFIHLAEGMMDTDIPAIYI